MRIFVEQARVSFASGLTKASAMEDGQTPKFGADFIFEPGKTKVYEVSADGKSKTPMKMDDLMLKVANETWKGKGQQMLSSLEASKKCWRNGDSRLSKAGEIHEGYEGKKYLVLKNKARPTLMDGQKNRLSDDEAYCIIYSGCYVNASGEIYGIADPKRKGVHGGLRGVQFHSDGEAFSGGGVAGDDEFDALEGAPADADFDF